MADTTAATKTIVLGVTGCIAAYKACEVVRRLQDRGMDVHVVMTEHATKLVGQTTFEALSHHPVYTDTFAAPGDPIPHISLASAADCVAIVPCTANMLAKITHGMADDLLSTTVLASTAPVVVAPAMNVHMYENCATQANLAILKERGFRIVEAGVGYLACGDEGKGRLADVDSIVDEIVRAACGPQDMIGLRVLVNAGPTREAIDAVRCVTNYSSGKTGYAIARAAAERGAKVTLVSGPVALDRVPGVETIDVVSAREMNKACLEAFEGADIAICTAAVADYRPKRAPKKKLKKGADDASLSVVEMVPNPDILAGLCKKKKKKQFVVGFAAETSALESHARSKLATKGADMIVANAVGGGKAFGTDDNSWLLVSPASTRHVDPMNKHDLAHVLLDEVLALRG